ncbi:MAG: HAD family hydrolase [Acidobacteriota bacterium]|nr:HAD family hydrolase [Acidobacteriota bacterium]
MDLAATSADQLLRTHKRLRRELLATPGLQPLRLAILGGSTTNELAALLELMLLSRGFAPQIYQSEYNRYYEDAVLDPSALQAFQPELVYLHTHAHNLQHLPPASATPQQTESMVHAELERFQAIWEGLQASVGCQIVQNNFDPPQYALLGNYDAVAAGGHTQFIHQLNLRFAEAARADPRLLVQDLHSIASTVGLRHWYDPGRWFSYKIVTTPEGSLAIARSLAAMIDAMRGRSRKCLILDLDNTLWGGVIGDDGLNGLQLGTETALAEAHTAFQRYCLALRERGVVLAVCSKNDDAIARSGFSHPDSVLRLEHFAAFKANWEPKHENIRAIAAELNLGLDSFVFVDDNPAERAIVAAQLPMVAVPEVGAEVALYPAILNQHRYFETISLSAEDMARAGTYAANAQRESAVSRFASYAEYLDSLAMTAEIAPFHPLYLERITQLINKTNQFNLTTRRYTYSEVEQAAGSPQHITLYGRLTDSFGDNGLISVILAHRLDAETVEIDLWLMSCRVLKRTMEHAMLDALAARARATGAQRLLGHYLPTAKNGLVASLLQDLGFSPLESTAERSSWTLDLTTYQPQNRHIRITEENHG